MGVTFSRLVILTAHPTRAFESSSDAFPSTWAEHTGRGGIEYDSASCSSETRLFRFFDASPNKKKGFWKQPSEVIVGWIR